MTQKEFDELRRGDIVRHVSDNESYTIEYSLDNSYIGVRTIEITNPSEWNLYKPKT